MILSLDIGGTKISAAKVAVSGRISGQIFSAPTKKSSSSLLKQILSIIENNLSPKVTAIAIGIAGQINNEKGIFISGPNLPRAFKNIRLKEILEKKFKLPVFIENDAHCFALGEAVYGAGKKFISVFGITIGTGVGGGLVINQKIDRGATDTVGEIGHIEIDLPQFSKEKKISRFICSCGQYNHLESFAGGASIARTYKNLTRYAVDMKTFEKLFNKNDRVAKILTDRANAALAIGFSTVMTLVNPDCIVVGGGLASFKKLWQPAIRKSFSLVPFSQLKKIPIIAAKLDSEAALIGAALLTLK